MAPFDYDAWCGHKLEPGLAKELEARIRPCTRLPAKGGECFVGDHMSKVGGLLGGPCAPARGQGAGAIFRAHAFGWVQCCRTHICQGQGARCVTSHSALGPQEDVCVHYPERSSFAEQPLTLKQLKRSRSEAVLTPSAMERNRIARMAAVHH